MKRVFKNQTVLSKMSPLCWSERAKAKSSKFFFCKKQFWDEGCCKLAAASAVGSVTQRAIAPQILTVIKGKPTASKDLVLLMVHPDFQTFLRICAIDGLWARLFWHLWMHVVFDSLADPTNLNKKESCSCSISPQSETCLPTTRHLFALCFRKMPVVEVCHMSTHKIWIQIHSTTSGTPEWICTRPTPPENSANEIRVYLTE